MEIDKNYIYIYLYFHTHNRNRGFIIIFFCIEISLVSLYKTEVWDHRLQKHELAQVGHQDFVDGNGTTEDQVQNVKDFRNDTKRFFMMRLLEVPQVNCLERCRIYIYIYSIIIDIHVEYL